jgi:hypothetical protein
LVRTDFEIFEVAMNTFYLDIYEIEISSGRRSFAKYLASDNIKGQYGLSLPLLVADKFRDKIYIFTPIGAVSFRTQ